MRDMYYVVEFWGCVEPTLVGPYDTLEERNRIARNRNRIAHDDKIDLFWLNIVGGVPTMGAFSESFLDGTLTQTSTNA